MTTADVPPVHLLHGDLLVALTDTAHVHHGVASAWFASHQATFATCPITQGTLLRLQLHLGSARNIPGALALLAALTDHPRHRFWPDALGYSAVPMTGVQRHRQVTDADLANLARHRTGKLATLDTGLVALHADEAAAAG